MKQSGKRNHGGRHSAGGDQPVRLFGDIFREIAPVGVGGTASGEADQVDQQRQILAAVARRNIDIDFAVGRVAQGIVRQHAAFTFQPVDRPHRRIHVPSHAFGLPPINERLAQLEHTTRAQGSEIAQDKQEKENAKPIDDMPLRRVVAASLLDISVRQGDPYVAALAAAKALTPDADALKPLDGFAASGVPTPANLCRELLTLVPKLSPPAPENPTADAGGIVDRLQAGVSRLVRIERTDAVGNDRGAVVARVTAAALRNDANEARRELNTLSPADRAAAQAWIDKTDARDAALAASRQFAADAMTALAKPAL